MVKGFDFGLHDTLLLTQHSASKCPMHMYLLKPSTTLTDMNPNQKILFIGYLGPYGNPQSLGNFYVGTY